MQPRVIRLMRPATLAALALVFAATAATPLTAGEATLTPHKPDWAAF